MNFKKLLSGYKLKILTIILIVKFISFCKEKDIRLYNFGPFSLELPYKWIVDKQKGVDSFVGIIITDKNDTIQWDYGYYGDELEEDVIIINDTTYRWYSNEIEDVSVVHLSRDPERDYREKKFHRERNDYLMINHKYSKIVYPRETGIGRTGAVIGVNEKVYLSIYGVNLDAEVQRALLKAITTITFNSLSE